MTFQTRNSKTLSELRILGASGVSDSDINNLELNRGHLYHNNKFGGEWKHITKTKKKKTFLKSKPPPISMETEFSISL